MDISQPEIASRMSVGELLVVEPKQVQNSRVQIVDMHLLINRGEAEFVRGAVHISTARSTAGQPNGEAVMVVVPPVDLARV